MIKPDAKKGFDFDADRNKVENKSWTLMLARGFKIAVLKCDCGGDLIPLGAVRDLGEVRGYLQHVNIEYDPPPRGPPKAVQGSLDFEQYHPDELEAVIHLD